MTHEITVEPTTDELYIKSVFLNPTIYAEMKDDSCPESPMILQGVDIKAVPGFFLRVRMDGEPVGCFWLIWKDAVLEAHTALLDKCRGRDAVEAAQKAAQWVWGHTQARAVRSYAWSDSPAVQWFCRAVGMRQTVRQKWPNTRGGHEVDILYYEMGRAV